MIERLPGIHMQKPNTSFHGLGIAPKLLEILSKSQYTIPTPISSSAFRCNGRKRVIGIAQTGTGKTLAFGVPMLQSLAQQKKKGLVVVPTRELAIQVEDALLRIASDLGLKTAVLIGGESMNRSCEILRMNPAVVIATPGRLIDHLEQRTIKLNETSILVLDEADRMLDMGFLTQIKAIFKYCRSKDKRCCSRPHATEIVSVAARYMKLPGGGSGPFRNGR